VLLVLAFDIALRVWNARRARPQAASADAAADNASESNETTSVR
jgi:hypothetical protein